MGDLLRAEQARKSELGRKIGRLIDNGHAVPPDVSYGLMVSAIAARVGHGPLVLDGVPRLVDQTCRVRHLLGGEPHAVVLLDVPVPVAVHRLLTRQTCERCGMPHGPDWPTVGERCQHCGGGVDERADDEPEKIWRRLDVWGLQARAIVTYYDDLGVLSTIPADREPSDVLDLVVLTLRC